MKLTVRFLGHRDRPVIGELFEAPDHRVYFQFDPAWHEFGLELSPLYLPAATPGSRPTPTPGFSPLFGLFDDSLPDWWGTQLLKRFFARLGIRWNRVGVLQKLAAQGGYGLGALGYEPDEAPDDFRTRLSLEVGELVEAAREVASGDAGDTLPQLIRSGISAGGAQPKALVHLSPDLRQVWPGGAEPPAGSVPWMIKFQLDRELPATREEHACHLLAAAAGIAVPETRLLEDRHGRVHFLSRRFDRHDDTRIHFHSFSGLTHSPPRDGLEYARLMELARTLCRSEPAAEECFRRAVFNVAVGNDDDHGRNHAFLMDAGGQWRLSPAYDLTFASHPLASNLRSASVLGKFALLERRDLVALGRDQGVRRIDDTIDAVLAALRRWPEFAARAGLSPAQASQLADEMPGLAW